MPVCGISTQSGNGNASGSHRDSNASASIGGHDLGFIFGKALITVFLFVGQLTLGFLIPFGINPLACLLFIEFAGSIPDIDSLLEFFLFTPYASLLGVFEVFATSTEGR